MSANPNPSAAQLRTLIVDDEPTARRGLRLLLSKLDYVEIVGEAGHADEAVELIGKTTPDLVLLDVQMPNGDAFDVIQRVGLEKMPIVIFITAYDEYALKAFEVNAVDYLLKPFEDERFFSALERARDSLRRKRVDDVASRLSQLLHYLETKGAETRLDPNKSDPFSDRIAVKSSGEILFLRAEEIDWVDAEGDYMVFHVAGRTHLLRVTMARLEARLDPKWFIRIHRSTIVNVERVRKLAPSVSGEYTVILQDGTKLKLSRSYQERLHEILKNTR